MSRRFHQYLYSLLFALLTVLGWYYGQIQQYVSTDVPPDFQFTADIRTPQKKNTENSFVFLKGHDTLDFYSIERPHYYKIRANLSENDTENDDNVETSAPSGLLIPFRDSFWRSTSNLVTTFHNKQISVSLARLGHLKPLHDDLYIEYRVIRL